MLEQLFAQGMAHIQLIIALLLVAGLVLELVHIAQTRKINKRLGHAGTRLQRYLDAVMSDVQAEEEPQTSEGQQETDVEPQQVQLSVSQQEQNMRTVIEQRKQQRDDELLDTVDAVLQEVFD